MRAAAVASGAVNFDCVFLTHLHSDHITDLNDLVTTRWVMSAAENPLKVIGPHGTQDLVARTLTMLEPDIAYRLAHHRTLTWPPRCEVTEIDVGDEPTVVTDGAVRVLAAATDHAPVRPSIGYRVEADGSSVVIAGDTIPCSGLDSLCAHADAYVQTVINTSMVKMIPAARLQDILDYHSSVQDAAVTAQRAGVAILVMTHPVPPPIPGTEQDWIDEAAAIYEGEIHLAEDLLTIEVPHAT